MHVNRTSLLPITATLAAMFVCAPSADARAYDTKYNEAKAGIGIKVDEFAEVMGHPGSARHKIGKCHKVGKAGATCQATVANCHFTGNARIVPEGILVWFTRMSCIRPTN